VPVPARVVAVAPARAPPTLFQSAEARVFWPLTEEAVGLSAAAPRAGQGPPQPAVRVMGSAIRAVLESERCLVSAPMRPTWVEVPRWVAATED